MIIRGKDKGETGIIKRVIRAQNRVIVEGKNLVFSPSCSNFCYENGKSLNYRTHGSIELCIFGNLKCALGV
jgi:KOW motif